MKRIISVVLVLLMLAIVAMPAGAAAKTKIAYVDDRAFGDYLGHAAIRPEQTYPGDEVIIPMMKEGFRDENGAIITTWDSTGTLGPTVNDLRRAKVIPMFRVIAGAQYIRDVQIVEFKPTPRIPAQAAVRVRFVEEIDSSKELTYQFAVYLHFNTSTTAEEVFGGMIRNEIYDVTNLDYLYIGDGQIADCSGTSMNLELDLGNGVSIYRDMYRGDRFYGRAKVEDNYGQDPILEAHKEIEYIYNVYTIKVKFNGSPVRLTNELENNKIYYVYNIAGEYIGTSHDWLPYSTRYYMSAKEIEIDPALSQAPELTKDEKTMGVALKTFVEGVKEESANIG